MSQFKKVSFILLPLLAMTVCAQDDDIVLSDRIDFSSARIMGQANDFGAVYLMHRKQNEMNSMLSIRSNYRLEILFDLQYQPVDEKTGELVLPEAFGSSEFEPGFELAESED